jgi:hypothetical protein
MRVIHPLGHGQAHAGRGAGPPPRVGQDYVRTARAKGLRESVVLLRHALRNAAARAGAIFSTG